SPSSYPLSLHDALPIFALGLRPHTAVLERPARGDLEHADVLARGVVDEQALLVQREAEPVGTVEVVHEQLGRRRVGAGAIDALRSEEHTSELQSRVDLV